MPFGRRHSRSEVVPEGVFWDSMSDDWQFRRPSRAHHHDHQRTTSLHGTSSHVRRPQFHTSYDPGYTESRQRHSLPSSAYTYNQRWQREEFDVYPFDGPAHTNYMHWQAEQRGAYHFDDSRHTVDARHESYHSYGYQEGYHLPERPHRNRHSWSNSAPQHLIASSSHTDRVAERCAPVLENSRQLLRSWKAAHVDDKTKRAQDRAKLIKIIEEVIHMRLEKEDKEKGKKLNMSQ